MENFLFNKYGHFPNAVCFQNYQRGIAKEALDADKELEAIYHLVESHAPYQRLLINSLKKEGSDKLDQIAFNCTDSNLSDNIAVLQQKIKQLPKEWTIVQLTPFLNIAECYSLQNTVYTNPLFVTVINGGDDCDEPFVVTVKSPKDNNGKYINICERYQEILADFNMLYKTNWREHKSHNHKSRAERRMHLDCQMKLCTNQLSNDWLGEWKCFLMGSFENTQHNDLLSSKLEEFLQEHDLLDLPAKTKIILKYLFKAATFLSSVELIRALEALELNSSFAKDFLTRSVRLNFHNLPRNPLVLILDEKLEIYPWEMIPILHNAPVTRMASLHFAHSLYNRYKDRIHGGYLSGINYDSGAYLINPGVDLPLMQERMSAFMSYWMPQWEGIVGRTPTEHEFEGLLQKGDIFVPCLLGMLHEVGDRETDLISTSILSAWIPSSASRKWSEIDTTKWMNCENKDIDSLPSVNKERDSCDDERNLLLILAKIKTNNTHSCIARSAFVARGLPIK